MSNNISDNDVLEMISTFEKNATKVETVDSIKNGPDYRNLLVIGCGDGGCHIASDISTYVKKCYTIAYNSSDRTMDSIRADTKILADDEDGAGKSRDYSKKIFTGTTKAYKHLLNKVVSVIEKDHIDYIIVVSTTDGGTGSGMSPMAAKLISDNVDVPVIIVGVYPSLAADAIAQYNTLQWQHEVSVTGLPYMIFDNNLSMPTASAHKTVNTQIVNCLKLISGELYGDNAISVIDNRDFLMMLQHTGKRITVLTSTIRPSLNEGIDGYIDTQIKDINQPVPEYVGAVGVFVKGPKDIIDKLDTAIPKTREKYGDPALHYVHLEESKDIRISVIFAGSEEPSDRIIQAKTRYDDIMANQKKGIDISSSVLDDMVNPMGDTTSTKNKRGELNLDVLNMF